jgi:hypothetical protein
MPSAIRLRNLLWSAVLAVVATATLFLIASRAGHTFGANVVWAAQAHPALLAVGFLCLSAVFSAVLSRQQARRRNSRGV